MFTVVQTRGFVALTPAGTSLSTGTLERQNFLVLYTNFLAIYNVGMSFVTDRYLSCAHLNGFNEDRDLRDTHAHNPSCSQHHSDELYGRRSLNNAFSRNPRHMMYIAQSHAMRPSAGETSSTTRR